MYWFELKNAIVFPSSKRTEKRFFSSMNLFNVFSVLKRLSLAQVSACAYVLGHSWGNDLSTEVPKTYWVKKLIFRCAPDKLYLYQLDLHILVVQLYPNHPCPSLDKEGRFYHIRCFLL